MERALYDPRRRLLRPGRGAPAGRGRLRHQPRGRAAVRRAGRPGPRPVVALARRAGPVRRRGGRCRAGPPRRRCAARRTGLLGGAAVRARRAFRGSPGPPARAPDRRTGGRGARPFGPRRPATSRPSPSTGVGRSWPRSTSSRRSASAAWCSPTSCSTTCRSGRGAPATRWIGGAGRRRPSRADARRGAGRAAPTTWRRGRRGGRRRRGADRGRGSRCRRAVRWTGSMRQLLHRGEVVLVDYLAGAASLVERGQTAWLRTYRGHTGGPGLGRAREAGHHLSTCPPSTCWRAAAGGVRRRAATRPGRVARHSGIDELVDEGAQRGGRAPTSATSRRSPGGAGPRGGGADRPAGSRAHRVLCCRRDPVDRLRSAATTVLDQRP